MKLPTDKELWLQGFKHMHAHTAVENLEITLVEIDDDHIELRMPISDKTRQPYGLLHGGVSMLLAETAASAHATWGVDLSAVQPVGIEINGSHLRSISEGEVRAVGSVVRRGKAIIVHHVEIISEESGKLISTIRVTNFYKPLKGS